MDINLAPRRYAKARKYRGVLMGLVCLTVSLVVFWSQLDSTVNIDRQSLIFDSAVRGPLALQVEAFGILKSAHQQTITTPSAGIVMAIMRKAGESVNKGDVIAVLSNDDLDLRLTKMQQHLEAVHIQYELDKIRQHREVLTEQAKLASIRGKLATLQIRYRAQEDLAKQGVVSQFSFLQTQAERNSLRLQLNNAQERIVQLQGMHHKELAIIKNKVALKAQELKALNRKIAALEIRAPSDGVIESMPLGLGESVQRGGFIASMGSQNELTAALQVAQTDAQKVQLGQVVEVKIGEQTAAARITRIDPVVTNHSVLVEAAMLNEVPTAARPKLSVEAVITVENLLDVVYIRRPVSSLTRQNGRIYRVLKEGKSELIDVVFGRQSGRYIIVEQGLNAGDTVILSDLNHLVQQGASLVIQ
ncbi:efflux RND transporter periplasmic adaptor subunit [Pseudoalteromonas luteoviolacea]|uniref:Uncharacterized protein n=1 Tax=Pseudoalteromonas luteoviolacea S4060-1 TaxID=1365257 RepID=A0A162CCW6_9GAMM|nr:HlyD family efflux transporter periplasmic adaptor subunit [Pseudoalteromonas luteoviolacea]KZN65851.1 hypothetical protein N478_20690 [Pseudoalteromonas luteoviolacea S4060-1]